ncbi:MAG: ECF RNA polymerase sigma factor SigW [uncultured marine phage]|uniref:ECF RNA polymerase sigma factor SigW n=1 Tax=uncultured marine phage TaxID=707152 RepID=A0A8D9C9Z7_9VIRU|nr:MAG: ECF RNA polymerase sigma factor SigW [uncultured marine phage]
MELKDRLNNAAINGNEKQLEVVEQPKETVDLNDQIKKFKQKTGQDFTSFYEKYLPKLIYYTQKYCRDEDEARDYAEESFISALEKIDTYDREKAGFSTWLFVIARNHVFQNIKKKKRIPTISMDTPVDDEGTTIKEFISGDELEVKITNERYSLNVKKAEIMMSSIEKLKSPYKSVIKMREIDKMSYKDIASELGKDVIFNLNVDESGEVKLPEEISEAYEVLDSNGEKVNFTLVEGDTKKTPFFTHIKLNVGDYTVKGRLPKNLSTVKSQIRNGRLKLQDMVKEDFQRLDDMYL